MDKETKRLLRRQIESAMEFCEILLDGLPAKDALDLIREFVGALQYYGVIMDDPDEMKRWKKANRKALKENIREMVYPKPRFEKPKPELKPEPEDPKFTAFSKMLQTPPLTLEERIARSEQPPIYRVFDDEDEIKK